MDPSGGKCSSCYGTGIDRLKSGFVKVSCRDCRGTGFKVAELQHGEE